MTADNLIVIIALGVFFLLAVLLWLVYLSWYVHHFIKQKKEILDKIKHAGVDSLLRENLREIEKNKIAIKELHQLVDHLSKLNDLSITRVGLVRFNPFGDTGGDQSFSIALINAYNNGIVVSSLHGRQGTRIYSKPVVNNESEYNLTTEEREAIARARGQENRK